ncbi:MAG: hypothetical protein WA839_01770 [Flavobacteriaceae bacterium]|tara:strand:+ start:14006 stop:14734 length:729 start_codon:yes stop_codon:yes gene_type:complete
MKLIKIIFTVLIISNFSCKIYAQKSEVDSIKNESKAQFDVAKATVIIEKRSKEFDNALIAGDSIAAGNLYTVDTKIPPNLIGRDAVIRSAGSLIRQNKSLRLSIRNLWGDDNIIVEDAYVEFYKIDGEVTSGFNVLLVWKNDGGTWRIFRDVPEPRKKNTSVSDLNNLGYELMDNEELEKALEVFKLNTILFPDNWNVYDSYGEGLMNANRKEESIEMYEKSIALNPKNEYGKEMILKMKQE